MSFAAIQETVKKLLCKLFGHRSEGFAEAHGDTVILCTKCHRCRKTGYFGFDLQ